MQCYVTDEQNGAAAKAHSDLKCLLSDQPVQKSFESPFTPRCDQVQYYN